MEIKCEMPFSFSQWYR